MSNYNNVHVEIANKVRSVLYETIAERNEEAQKSGGRPVYMKLTETGVSQFISAIAQKARGETPRPITARNDMTPKEAKFLNEQVASADPSQFLATTIEAAADVAEEVKQVLLTIAKAPPLKREAVLQACRHLLPKVEAFGLMNELEKDLSQPGSSGRFYAFYTSDGVIG